MTGNDSPTRQARDRTLSRGAQFLAGRADSLTARLRGLVHDSRAAAEDATADFARAIFGRLRQQADDATYWPTPLADTVLNTQPDRSSHS